MQQVGHLQKLNDKYFDKGLRVITITNEPGSAAQTVIDQGGLYWIASEPNGATMKRYSNPGSKGIPRAYLIDASGTVVSSGVPSEAQIEKLLEDAFVPGLGKQLHKSLKSAVKLYDKGDYGKAYAAAARATTNEDRAIASDAEYLRKCCEEVANWYKKQVEGSIQSKDYATAYADFKTIPKDFAGMEIVGWAKETKAKLDADKSVQTELKAYKAFEKAQKKEEAAEGKAKKLGPARKAYKSIVKKYPGTRAAKLAEEALRALPG